MKHEELMKLPKLQRYTILKEMYEVEIKTQEDLVKNTFSNAKQSKIFKTIENLFERHNQIVNAIKSL